MKNGKKLAGFIRNSLKSAIRCIEIVTPSSTNDWWNCLQLTVASGISTLVEDTLCQRISLLILVETTL